MCLLALAIPVRAKASAPAQDVAGAPTTAPGGTVPDLPVRIQTLENGLRVAVLPRKASPTVAFAVYTGVGGVDETPGETGIAHLLEHLLFKGTTTIGTRSLRDERRLFQRIDAVFDSIVQERGQRGGPDPTRLTALQSRLEALETEARRFVIPNELDRIYAENGARGLNATTTAEETIYFVELPANRLELWMILEADRRLNPVFREFHTERDVVLEERSLRVDTDPAGKLYEAHLATAFSHHPYRQPVVGTRDDLERIDRSTVREYFDRFYGARNTVIAIVGDVDPDEVLRMAEEYFGDLRPGEVPEAITYGEPPQTGEKRVEVLFEAQPRVRIGWHIPPATHPDGPALDMLAAVLTAGRSSRLHRRLITEERIASSVVSTSAPGRRYSRLFVVEGLPTAGHTVGQLENTVYDELARIETELPDEIELQRVRNQLRAGSVRRLRSNLSLAFELSGAIAQTGDWREAFLRTERLLAVTPADLQRVVRTYLNPWNRTVAVLRRPDSAEQLALAPEAGADAMDAVDDEPEPPSTGPSEDVSVATTFRNPSAPNRSRIGRAAALAFEPPPLEYDERAPQIRRVRGVDVVYLEDQSLPLANFYFRINRGFSNLPRDRYAGVTALSSTLQNGGTADLPPDSVSLLIDLLAIESSFSSTGEAMASGFNVLTENVDPALELWRQILLEPRFDSTEVEVWRTKELDYRLRSEDSPQSVAYASFNKLMFGDHPIGWDLEPADLTPDHLNVRMLREVHRALFCRDHLVIGVSGALTWEQVEAKLDALLAEWPRCERTLPESSPARVRVQGGMFLIPRKVDQATVVLGQPSSVREGDADTYFASRVANAILGSSGMSSRLMRRVRTESGFAYGATSTWTAPRKSDGILAMVTNSRSATTVPAAGLMLTVLKEMSEEAPTDSEVRAVRDEITNGMVFSIQSAGQIVQRRMAFLAQDIPVDWQETYLREIQRVSPEDVLRVIRSEYDPSQITLLVVGDPDVLLPELEQWGPVVVLEDGVPSEPPVGATSSPHGSPRSPR